MISVEESSVLRRAVESLMATIMLVVLEREFSKSLGRLMDWEDKEEVFIASM